MRRLAACAVAVLALAACLVATTATSASAVVPKTPPLTTPWTNQVSTTNPLPDYPRPQMTRPDWQSLNGEWQFLNPATDGAGNVNRNAAPPLGQTLPERILVPYPVESALSGIMRNDNRDLMFYRRTFTVPSAWSGRRVQLHFGAVDYEATVWNEFMRKRGWNDVATERLVMRKGESGFTDRTDIQTFFDYIDADEA